MADKMRTALLVDDNRMGRELAAEVLATAGFLVREASSVGEALDALNVWCPDVVLLDWHLQGATGDVVLRQLQTMSPRPYVVIVTADARDSVRSAAITGGADSVLTKPYRISALAAMMADAAPEQTEGSI